MRIFSDGEYEVARMLVGQRVTLKCLHFEDDVQGPGEDLAAGPALVRLWLGMNERIFCATNLNQITTHTQPTHFRTKRSLDARSSMGGWI